MDGQGGNTEKRLVYLDQSRGVSRAFLSDDYAPRNGKIAIEPRMPYTTPVGLYTDLKIARGRTFRNGSNLCTFCGNELQPDEGRFIPGG